MIAFRLVSFLSSFLLFQIELIAAKLLLPLFGGSFYVWTTCMMFFTGTLFFGYAYADVVSRKQSPRAYGICHILLLLAGAWFFPIVVKPVSASVSPTWNVIGALTMAIGGPFFMLSTTSPLIQSWFSHSRHTERDNPYFLYAASNTGALIALLSYPIVVEPFFTVPEQLRLWYAGYLVLLVAHIFCIPPKRGQEEKAAAATANGVRAIVNVAWLTKAYWLCVAASATALLLAATNAVALEIAAVPLLWMIPLSIFLVTIILNFKKMPWYPYYLNAVLLIMLMALVVTAVVKPQLASSKWAILAHWLFLFIGCMMCHRHLYLSKPGEDENLTTYYSFIGLGGWVGSALVTLGIPLLARHVANSLIDYALAVALFLAGLLIRDRRALLAFARRRVVIFTLIGVSLIGFSVWSGSAYMAAQGRNYVYALRNFYGISRVIDEGGFRLFVHGSTTHGKQYLDPGKRSEPLMYHDRRSPIGDIFRMERSFDRVGIVGLGIGAMSSYSEPGQTWDYFELDPDVVDMANRYFTFLRDSPVEPRIVVGDGRLSLEKEEHARYDLFVVDAFSSDSIPVHLLTREALLLYLEKVSPDALIAFHISNRFLTLTHILADLAGDQHLYAAHKTVRNDTFGLGDSGSVWFVMSRAEDAVAALVDKWSWQDAAHDRQSKRRVWTDSYVNIISALLGP